MKLIISVCFLFISIIQLRSQCTPAAADNCEDAIILCSLQELNGYTCTTTDYRNQTGCNPLCQGSTDRDHNMSWWAFVTIGGNVCVTLSPANCTYNHGVQIGITEVCDCSKSPIACDAICPGLGPKVICANLEPCKVYYLFVDGCSGDHCDFTINTSGGGPPQLDIPISLSGETQVCVGQCTRYIAELTGNCISQPLWVLDGKDLKFFTSEIDLEWPVEGSFELCVKSILGHPGGGRICTQSNKLCKTIKVSRSKSVNAKTEFVCEYKFPFYWGKEYISTEGIYTSRFKAMNCCEIDSVKEFITIPNDQKPCSEDAYLSGRVFLDNDNNDIFSVGDQLLNNYLVFSPTSSNSSFTRQGIYKLAMIKNTTNEVRIQLMNTNYYSAQPQVYNVNVGNQTGLIVGSYDFAIKVKDINDLRINVAGNSTRAGRRTQATIIVSNDGPISNGQTLVSFAFPVNWKFVTTSQTNYVLNNNILSWIVPTPVHPNNFIITVELLVPANEVVGNKFKYDAKVDNPLDINLVNNNAVFEDMILAPFDPNDKLVDHKIISENYNEVGTELTYTIRFQNVGNAPAKDVFVYDTIGQFFDPISIRFVSSSHPCQMIMDELGFLKFDFLDINLADTSKGLLESQGFVQFSIRTKKRLDNGTILKNRATIVFEDLEGIATNEAITRVIVSDAKNKKNENGFTIYPNPVSDELIVSLPTEINSNYQLEIINLNGKKMLSQDVKNSDHKIINLKTIPAGVYMLKILKEGEKLKAIRFVKNN